MSLISLIKNPKNIFNKNSLLFSGREYPILFFSLIKKFFKEKNKIEIRSINLEEINIENLTHELSLSFLGNRIFYWFGNLSDYSAKNRKDLLDLAIKYQGPNVVSFFCSEESLNEQNSINCNVSGFTKSELEIIIEFVLKDKKTANISNFFDKLDVQKLNLDQIIILVYYSNVLGTRSKKFFNNWSEKIIQSESSLFTLTSLLFSKNPKSFFEYWIKIKDNYTETFWTVFWIEQAFRAYWFIYYKCENDFKNMKRISFKLPFSFINGDFRKNSLKKLHKFQNRLYFVDCALKQGNSLFILDTALAEFINS